MDGPPYTISSSLIGVCKILIADIRRDILGALPGVGPQSLLWHITTKLGRPEGLALLLGEMICSHISSQYVIVTNVIATNLSSGRRIIPDGGGLGQGGYLSGGSLAGGSSGRQVSRQVPVRPVCRVRDGT